MPIFKYGKKEIEYLKSKDKKLGTAIDRIGMVEREVTPDPFIALISSIIGQQISNKAAETVWNRLINLVGDISPENILHVSIEAIQSCGMSLRKAGYIRGAAEAAVSGSIDFNNLYMLRDEEIIHKLSSLHGVGIWTAEMLLIFSLCRPDVISYNDLVIRRGIMHLYGLSTLSKKDFQKYRKRYSPYGTVASLYLWRIAVI